MESIKRLKELLLYTSIFFLFLFSIMSIGELMNIEAGNLISIILNTLLAGSLALGIAVYIYVQEQEDKYESYKKMLISYLNQLKESEEADEKFKLWLEVKPVNRTIINTIIQSGFFNDLSYNLVRLQLVSDLYYFAFENHVNSIEKRNESAARSFLSDSHKALKEEAEKTLKELD